MSKKYLGVPIIISDSLLAGAWYNIAPKIVGANAPNTAFLGLIMMLSILLWSSGIYYSAKFYRKYGSPSPPKTIPFSSLDTAWPQQTVSPTVESEISKILSP
jgi:hypothetical protein